MNDHKHNPCSAYPPVRRYFEFLFRPLKYIDMKSKTGICEKCGKPIIPPNIAFYLAWVPVIYSALFFIFLKPLAKLRLHWFPVFFVGVLFVFGWMVSAAILAFGKWKDEKPSGMTNEEFIAQRARDRNRRRGESVGCWQFRVPYILTILIWIALLIVYFNPYA